jgi:hypothetical protein
VLALFYNTGGYHNTANGFSALGNNTVGDGNTASGDSALNNNTTGTFNTANGIGALLNNTTRGQNTANGAFALQDNTTGYNNTAVGFGAGRNVTTADNVISIGADVGGENVSHSCYIGQIWNQSGGTQAVYVNSNGKLGASTSSRRFKDEIKPMEQASEVIYALHPVRFRYKAQIEPARPGSFGLIAEDVEIVAPDLVMRDKEGKPFSVRYDQVNAMLLNEFLKEHRKVQQQTRAMEEQKATIAELRSRVAKQDKTVEALAAHVREQDAKIQRVSAQFEVNRPAPHMSSR